MKQKKLYSGIFFILLAILVLFFSPVIYHWYFDTFKIPKSPGASVAVALSIMLLFFSIGITGVFITDEHLSNRNEAN